MVILIISLLLFLALLPVLLPFFKSSEESPLELEQDQLQELLAEKETVYAAIKELELDQQAGKLSVEDYEQARHSYELRAISLLQRIDRLGGQRGSSNEPTEEERRS